MDSQIYILILLIFAENGDATSECSDDNSPNDSMVQISEETILTALEASQLQLYDLDYTRPITIEIGANDHPHQDSSIILGKVNI